EMERGKRALSEQPSTTLRVHYEGEEYRCELDEDTLARLAEPLLERLRQPVERAMRDARIRTAELDKVVLAGGATRMP
ncbi:Hsp70 family protein, partial [Salmonella enterica]